jgi:hypothetical protein
MSRGRGQGVVLYLQATARRYPSLSTAKQRQTAQCARLQDLVGSVVFEKTGRSAAVAQWTWPRDGAAQWEWEWLVLDGWG